MAAMRTMKAAGRMSGGAFPEERLSPPAGAPRGVFVVSIAGDTAWRTEPRERRVTAANETEARRIAEAEYPESQGFVVTRVALLN